ncbi:MAG: sigma-70 family RNA polymerase sigma factor [Acidobacteria bacterium]|nr:sigma-70 family RNA polymerase sigma factor [Acidobacteriota bacterium]
MSTDPGQITRLLSDIRGGKPGAQHAQLEAVYPELKQRAAAYLRGERPGHTLQATALVNEAYMQLLGQPGAIPFRDRTHFFAVAAQAMRRILVDYARRRAAKREGARARVEFTDALAISEDRLDEVVAIDEALTRLAVFDARQSRIVEMRFFGGLTEEEIAEILGVTSRTVKRDWKIAKAWLHGELTGGGSAASAAAGAE